VKLIVDFWSLTDGSRYAGLPVDHNFYAIQLRLLAVVDRKPV